MIYAVVVRARAGGDISRAADAYERQRDGLGARFVDEIDRALASLMRLPLRHQEILPGVRRLLTRRFPFAVFYVVEPARVVVLAVLHQAVDPARWPGRR